MPVEVAKEADEVGVTWETYVDLGKPAGLKVIPAASIGSDATYVCSTYVLGRPFAMPGNVVGRCAACSHPVQMRPHAPEAPRKVCVPCALSEGMSLPAPDTLRPTGGPGTGKGRGKPRRGRRDA